MKSDEIVDEIKRILKKNVTKVGDFHLKSNFEKPSVPKPVRRNISLLRTSLDPLGDSRKQIHSSTLNIYPK